MNTQAMTFTVTLTVEIAQRLEQQAQQMGLSPEDLLRQHITVWLDNAPASPPNFADAAAYVLEKNAELYRRLS